MPTLCKEVRIDCFDDQGRVVGVIRVVQMDRDSASIRTLTRQEAKEHGEEEVQLLEGSLYDFELITTRPNVRVQANGIVKPSSIRPEIGRLETGLETGLVFVVLEDSHSGNTVARASVEVLSSKLNYREDYRRMLDLIASECSELLFNIRSNSQMRLAPKYKAEPRNLQRQVEFLRAELESPRFKSALGCIMSMPHQRLQSVTEQRKATQPRRTGKDLARQVSTARRRLDLPDGSPLALIMVSHGVEQPSVPAVIVHRQQVETLDTPENRFVKHVLVFFSDFLMRLELILKTRKTGSHQRLHQKVVQLRQGLEDALRHEFFKSVSRPHLLPLGSPVLQRKSGYRDILLSWLRFDIASEMAWRGGEDVYGAGKRDIATLYEYWLFFQLLRLFSDKFGLSTTEARSLFEHSDGGLNLRLRINEPLGIEAVCIRESRRLKVRLHYNLTHSSSESRSQPGSWTRRMRPDYTMSFWPENYSLEEAESQELAVHIHFDAKYRVENITEIFGAADDDLSVEKAQQKQGKYKRADLLKMHAYRDAIRRSEGAYVIYPGGRDNPTRFEGFHEILPGLGAFAIKPGPSGEGEGLQHLSRFFDEVIAHVCSRATAREQNSYHRFAVYEASELSSPQQVFSAIPERESEAAVRSVPPAEHSVLVGWCDSPEHLDWFKKTGLYNLRAGLRQGSVRLEPSIADARHLMLHAKGGKALSGLWRIKKRGPRIFTAEELLRRGYPSQPDPNAIYAVFDVEPDNFYRGWEWDYTALKGSRSGYASAQPFAVSLLEVLSIHRL
jgi:predicted component of viral defense system (DUF524 family)